ncbi:MAG: PKD domain-containing protein, partial [Candidatus Gracilibacteria bacterium]|nr:PKD domain-containing protein [Candidatus Gracilibacteria bacterium]
GEGGTNIVKYEWNFGDGSSGVGETTTHKYAKDDIYKVTLIGTTKDGEKIEEIINVDTRNNLEISYTRDGGNSYKFKGEGGTNIVKYEWNFGDGSSGVGETTTHKYAKDDIYKVTLIGTTNDGEKVEEIINVDTRNNLEISYTRDGENSYKFKGEGGTNIVKYEWNFGDGSSGVGETTTHKYAKDDIYKVKLIGTTNDGEKVEEIIYIDNENSNYFNNNNYTESNNKLSINANPISGNTPLIVNFYSIFSGNTNQASYSWDFGDGTSSFGKNTEHIYKESGVYKVTLTVKDNLGEISISNINILVLEKNLDDTDGDGVDNNEDYEKNTSKEKIIYICTKEDIINKRYDCKTEDKLGVYSEIKKQSDTDGDGVDNDEDYEKNTSKEKIIYICTKEDIINKRYDCKTEDKLGVYSSKKENSLIGDVDGDGIDDLSDACPQIKGDINNKGCPIFDSLCKIDSDCAIGFYCNSGVCSPKQVSKNCEYTGGDLIVGNVVCNSCPCNNFVDFNASLRSCDIVFPAIVSPDSKTIYSKGNYFQIK